MICDAAGSRMTLINIAVQLIIIFNSRFIRPFCLVGIGVQLPAGVILFFSASVLALGHSLQFSGYRMFFILG
jgi:hypothetical protein